MKKFTKFSFFLSFFLIALAGCNDTPGTTPDEPSTSYDSPANGVYKVSQFETNGVTVVLQNENSFLLTNEEGSFVGGRSKNEEGNWVYTRDGVEVSGLAVFGVYSVFEQCDCYGVYKIEFGTYSVEENNVTLTSEDGDLTYSTSDEWKTFVGTEDSPYNSQNVIFTYTRQE